MNPIKDIYEVISNWGVFVNERYPLYAFFLYGEHDTIGKYARKYYNDLNNQSGDNLLIFLLDDPPESISESRKKEALNRIIEYRNEFRVRDNQYQSYDKKSVDDIANYFNLLPENIPCAIFFRNINNRNGLILPLNSSWSEETFVNGFKDLFSKLIQLERELHFDRQSFMTEKEFKRIQDLYWDTLTNYVESKKDLYTADVIYNHPLVRTIKELIIDFAIALLKPS